MTARQAANSLREELPVVVHHVLQGRSPRVRIHVGEHVRRPLSITGGQREGPQFITQRPNGERRQAPTPGKTQKKQQAIQDVRDPQGVRRAASVHFDLRNGVFGPFRGT